MPAVSSDHLVGRYRRLSILLGRLQIKAGSGADALVLRSRQAIAGYAWDYAAWNGITFSGVLGYKALYVDYAQGEGRRRYEFDMLQHGPVIGLSIRF
jgi:hypothetical protein